MKARTLILAGLVCFASLPGLQAQTVPSAVSGATTTATGAAGQASGLLGLIQAACGALKACKAKLCACPLGQMISNMTKPINMATGNLLCGPCCPDIDPNDLKKGGPQGACAKIRQEMAEVPQRRAAVRCLAYIDCHWYPEAEKALVDALRVDRSECVRLEAAVALGSGCCCTRRTIEALTLVVNGGNKDGNPSENSPRVKQAAYITLQKCVSAYHDETEPERPEKPAPEKPTAEQRTPDGTPVQLAKSSMPDEAQLMAKAVAEARRALAENRIITASKGPKTGERSLTQMWDKSAQEEPAAVAAGRASPEPPQAMSTDRAVPESPRAMPTERVPESLPAMTTGRANPQPPAPALDSEAEPQLMKTGRRNLFQMWSDSFRKPLAPPPPQYIPSPAEMYRY